jgi:hypothetical protein
VAEDKVYSGDQVVIQIGDTLIEAGYADGEFLRIEQESDDWSDVVGTDGEVAISKSNDARATLTLLLLQTSRHNDELSAMRNNGLRTGRPGVGPLFVRDLLGNSLHEAPVCWIQKPPDRSFDRTATTREWKLRVGQLKSTDGGNIPA